MSDGKKSQSGNGEFTINTPAQIINGKFSAGGWGGSSVRFEHPSIKGDTGFCTTAYSYNMSREMREYSAARIRLAMQLLEGCSNEQIMLMIAERQTAEQN